VDKLAAAARGAFRGVSTTRLATMLIVPMITICWILIFDPRLFGH
jgi:hypothetical protein